MVDVTFGDLSERQRRAVETSAERLGFEVVDEGDGAFRVVVPDAEAAIRLGEAVGRELGITFPDGVS
jgi:hypothetical protein